VLLDALPDDRDAHLVLDRERMPQSSYQPKSRPGTGLKIGDVLELAGAAEQRGAELERLAPYEKSHAVAGLHDRERLLGVAWRD
jgi:hypothetical protein